MQALNPTDQVFDFEELEYHYLVANRTEDVTTSKDDDDDYDEDGNEREGKQDLKEDKNSMDQQQTSPGGSQSNRSPNIDNPYLKAAKAPKRIKSEASVSLNF